MKVKVQELKDSFLKYLSAEGATGLCAQIEYEDLFFNCLNLIQERGLSETEAKSYLESENNFLIEMLIRFTKKTRSALPAIAYENLDILKKLLWQKPVSCRDYDERIRAQSLQFQIDHYYQSKTEYAKSRIEAVMGMLKPRPQDFILDIGCGVGTFTYHTAVMGANSIGIDYSQESIRVARRLSEQFKLSQKAKFIVSDGTELPFRNLCFDKIIASDFIEHISCKDKVMLVSEIHRTLRDNGWAVISTPNLFRETLGWIKRRLESLLWRAPVIETRLHFGLTDRFKFERLLRQKGFQFRRYYFDESRPSLAKIPLIKEFLSLHILWRVWK